MRTAGVARTVVVILVLASREVPALKNGTSKKNPEKLSSTLIDDLFEGGGYSAHIRPVLESSKAIQVYLYMRLHQIIELNSKEEFIKFIAWFKIQWNDDFLTWNPEEYGGLDEFHITSSSIWRPDILVYNSVDENKGSHEVLADTNAIVHNNGSIIWYTSALLKVSCKFDVSKFPFDSQNCSVPLGSWTYDSSEVQFNCGAAHVEISSLVRNDHWTLLHMPCVAYDKGFDEDGFTDVYFQLVIQRRSLFYLYNLLFPCLLLCVIGVMVFLVPAESGEKTSLAVTILLAMVVYLLVIMEYVPPSSSVIPLLSKFLGAVVAVLSIVTMLSILLIRISYHGQSGEDPPKWLRIVVMKWLAKLVLHDGITTRQERAPSHSKRNGTDDPSYDCTGSENLPLRDGQQAPDFQNGMFNSTQIPAVFNKIANRVDAMADNMEKVLKDKARAEEVQSEWTQICRVIDKTCFVIFTIVTVGILIGTFVYA